MADLDNDLLRELECPVCMDYMVPPIKLCQTGHSICHSCRAKLASCPLCKKLFSNARNICLENVIHKIHFPCMNKSLGCNAKVIMNEREAHKKNCPYRTYDCAINGCPWSGKLEELEEHWSLKNLPYKYGPDNTCAVKVNNNSNDLFYVANLVQAHGQMFWFKLQLERGRMCWAVQYLGLENNVKNYSYTVIVSMDNSKTYSFKDFCLSVNIQNKDLFNDGITATLDFLRPFIHDQHTLAYRLCIHDERNVKSQETRDVNRKDSKKRKLESDIQDMSDNVF